MNIRITNKLDSEPRKKKKPKRSKTIPRYIGFLLYLNIPSVNSFTDSSPGFTVVPKCLRCLSAIKLNAIPNKTGTIPIYFQFPFIR